MSMPSDPRVTGAASAGSRPHSMPSAHRSRRTRTRPAPWGRRRGGRRSSPMPPGATSRSLPVACVGHGSSSVTRRPRSRTAVRPPRGCGRSRCSGTGCPTAPRGSRARSGVGLRSSRSCTAIDQAGRAEPALHRALVDERLLHVGERAALGGEALDGDDLGCPTADAASTRHAHTSALVDAAPSTTRTRPARTRPSRRAARAARAARRAGSRRSRRRAPRGRSPLTVQRVALAHAAAHSLQQRASPSRRRRGGGTRRSSGGRRSGGPRPRRGAPNSSATARRAAPVGLRRPATLTRRARMMRRPTEPSPTRDRARRRGRPPARPMRDRDHHRVAHPDLEELLRAAEHGHTHRRRSAHPARARSRFGPDRNSAIGSVRRRPADAPRPPRRAPTARAACRRPATPCRGCRRCVAGVADLRRTDGAGGLGQGRQVAGERRLHELGVGHARSEPDRLTLDAPPTKLGDPADRDDIVGTAMAEVDLDHEVGAAREHLRSRTVRERARGRRRSSPE